jgi:hypothetical protein
MKTVNITFTDGAVLTVYGAKQISVSAHSWEAVDSNGSQHRVPLRNVRHIVERS